MGWRVKSEKLRRCSCSASSPSFALSLQPLRAASLALACLAATQPTPPRHHCQQAPAPPQHHQPPPPRPWSTFSPARLPRLPLTSCPACWALTIRFLLPSVTPLAFSPPRLSAPSSWLP